jgi:actin-related protein 2
MEGVKPIICDNGSGYLKMGIAGENLPKFTIPGIIGRPMLRSEERIGNIEIKSIMVGDEVTPVRSMLELTYPIKEGIVTDWADMELLWRYAFFDKLKINEKDCSQQKIMLTEAAQNPKANREKMAEIMFEKFGFGYLKIEVQAILSLFAEGLMSGIVLDSGDGVSHCIPVYDGYILPDQLKRLNAAGRHVTDYMVKLLLLRGYAFNSSADFETVKEIKEGVCYVAHSIAKDRKLA